MKKTIFMCLVALFAIGTANADEPKKDATTVFITDIDCAGCAKKVNDTIPYEKGVKDVQVDVDAKTVTVKYNPSKTDDETIIKAFAKIKINASVKGACQGDCCHSDNHEAKSADKKACDDDCCSDHNHGHSHGHNHSH